MTDVGPSVIDHRDRREEVPLLLVADLPHEEIPAGLEPPDSKRTAAKASLLFGVVAVVAVALLLIRGGVGATPSPSTTTSSTSTAASLPPVTPGDSPTIDSVTLLDQGGFSFTWSGPGGAYVYRIFEDGDAIGLPVQLKEDGSGEPLKEQIVTDFEDSSRRLDTGSHEYCVRLTLFNADPAMNVDSNKMCTPAPGDSSSTTVR